MHFYGGMAARSIFTDYKAPDLTKFSEISLKIGSTNTLIDII